MNQALVSIALREASQYLRSISLLLGTGVMLTAVLSMGLGSLVGPLEHFLGGHTLSVLLTAFIATLVMSAGLARESRECFDDIWNSLPARNREQFFGKTLGAGAVVAVMGMALSIVVVIGWLFAGTVWTSVTSAAVAAFLSQTLAVLMLSVGIATFLYSTVRDLRVRYVVGLGIVVVLSVVQALGIDNDSMWAVLFSPYVFAEIPYSYSSLFGMFPWFSAVVSHIAFQVTLSLALIVSGSLLYKRHRDHVDRPFARILVLGLLIMAAMVSVIQYERYWNDVDEVFNVHLELDRQPGRPLNRLETGGWERGQLSYPFNLVAYDIDVQWIPGDDMRITAVLTVEGESTLESWPFTLHHQWDVDEVAGQGVIGWDRRGNALWIEMEPGVPATQITFHYSGHPFLWHRPVGRISPMHFVSEHGGYLSPLLAWYPLPGERVLVDGFVRGTGNRSTRYWTHPVDDLPLVAALVPITLRWHGPASLDIVSNLTKDDQGDDQGVQGDRRTEVFSGYADGISLLFGPLIGVERGDFKSWGAATVMQPSDALGAAYDELLGFYNTLIGRAVPREAVGAVPEWLRSFYVTYRRVPVHVLGGEGASQIEVFPLLGTTPIVTEQDYDKSRSEAERWSKTGDPLSLLAATEKIHYGLLQSLWGRPHPHLTFAKQPVAFGLAQYSLLRWIEHVLGPGEASRYRSSIVSGDASGRNSHLDMAADHVLIALIELEEAFGADTVAKVLGVIYDSLEMMPLDVTRFEEIVNRAKAGALL